MNPYQSPEIIDAEPATPRKPKRRFRTLWWLPITLTLAGVGLCVAYERVLGSPLTLLYFLAIPIAWGISVAAVNIHR